MVVVAELSWAGLGCRSFGLDYPYWRIPSAGSHTNMEAVVSRGRSLQSSELQWRPGRCWGVVRAVLGGLVGSSARCTR